MSDEKTEGPTIAEKDEHLVLECAGWPLARIHRETKVFELLFPLDDEDATAAELKLLRALG